MKRSGSPQQSTDAARQAAERLREATNLLAGTQQQLASGKLDSLCARGRRACQEERAQADRIDKLVKSSQQADPEQVDLGQHDGAMQERDRLAGSGSNSPMIYRACRKTCATLRVKWLPINPVWPRSCAMR